MMWLSLSIVFALALALSFGASFLSSGWKKRRRTEPELLAIETMLPGYDCGLCGYADCRSYAAALDRDGADPSVCGPGGSRLEARLRATFAERLNDGRGVARRAVVRCGGHWGAAEEDFPYDGPADCGSAIELYGGPKRCKEGCLGLGSCAVACPLGAIRLGAGLAYINPAVCTGCGVCIKACPSGVISLVTREQSYYVACSSRREPKAKAGDCAKACTACGECTKLSGRSEFSIEGRLATENLDATSGKWSEIAANCPTSAIVQAGAEKKRHSPFRNKER
jgi:Na+-translocating ferredoxin:NAD+ oxidoreductase subunit B